MAGATPRGLVLGDGVARMRIDLDMSVMGQPALSENVARTAEYVRLFATFLGLWLWP